MRAGSVEFNRSGHLLAAATRVGIPSRFA
jgi:hypothetical protein